MFDFIKNIGPTELIVVLLILIVFFGGKAITRLARTGGETIKEVKKVKKEFTAALELDDDENKKSDDDNKQPSEDLQEGVSK